MHWLAFDLQKSALLKPIGFFGIMFLFLTGVDVLHFFCMRRNILECIVEILNVRYEASSHSLWCNCLVSFGKKNIRKDIFFDAMKQALEDREIKLSEKNQDMYVRNIDEETLDCLLRLGVE